MNGQLFFMLNFGKFFFSYSFFFVFVFVFFCL